MQPLSLRHSSPRMRHRGVVGSAFVVSHALARQSGMSTRVPLGR
jgi:hypothetical protein